MTRRVALALALVASLAHADEISDGNRLYHLGKYDEAAQAYGDALVDSPGSPLLRFNLAAAQYKQDKFADAVSTLEKIGAGGDPELEARAAYNLGNTLTRLAESQAAEQPEEAIKSYEAALLAFKRAMGADPRNEDPKFNHEVAARQLAELKKKLEEERKKQEEQQQQQEPQDQQQQEQQEDEQKQDEQQEGGSPEEQNQSSEQEKQPQPQPQPGEGEEQQPAEGEPQPEPQPEPGSEAVAGEPSEQELDQQEAHGVLDTARGEEVRPEEVQRMRGPAAVAEPAQDW